MSSPTRRSSVSADSYFRQTRLPLNNLAVIVPLLAAFHLGSLRVAPDLLAPELIGTVLQFFGATAPILPPLLIVAALLAQQAVGRYPWTLQPRALAGIVAESILWTLPLIALWQLAGRVIAEPTAAAIAAQVPGAAPGGTIFSNIVLAIGAGVYEEFLFRLVLISGTLAIFVDIFELKAQPVAVAAVLVSAVVFAGCHYGLSDLANPTRLPWGKAVFLAMAGLLWGGVYLFRGFGIAVGAHILWDLYASWS
jgi:hypothetical protein